MKKTFLKRKFNSNNILTFITPIILIVFFIAFSLLSPVFLQLNNLVNILSQISTLVLVAVGLSFVVASGGIDLSIAASYGLGAMVSILLLQAQFNWFIAIFAAIITGIIIGSFNSLLILKGKITIFLATLGTLFIGESIERIVTTGGSPVYLPGMSPIFKFIGRGSVFVVQQSGSARIDLKFSVIVALIVAILAHILLSKTTFGRMLYAIGSQKEAAELSGVPVKRYTFYAFIICSITCSLAGIVGSSILTAYIPLSGRYYLMDAIGAVFIGSTLNKKGFPNIPGTLIGVLFFGIVSNGLNLIGISFYWQGVARGLLIFFILVADAYKTKSSKKVNKVINYSIEQNPKHENMKTQL